MVFVTNLYQYLLQATYWLGLAVLVKLLYLDTVKNKYAFTTGKVTGACGALLALLGLDGCADAFFSFVRDGFGDRPDAYDQGLWEQIYRVHGITHLPVGVASAMLLIGSGLFFWGVYSWSYTRPEMKDVRLADLAKNKAEEEAERRFKSAGELISIRTTVAKGGFFSSTERFTEVETTQGVLVVDGEVGTIAKGVPVYRNGLGKVRIGGLYSRSFDMRRI